MKSIIIDGFWEVNTRNICDIAPFDKVFYIGPSNETLIKNDKLEIYDCYELPLGHYPNDFFQTEPLDENIINQFSNCESIVMKMFERNDFWFQASYNQRKEWYLMHLRYWYHIIYKFNVVCFMKSNFAHEVYDYVIYSIIKNKQEKCFFFSQLSFMNRFILEEDIFSYPILDSYLKANNKNIEICDELKTYLRKQREPAKKTKNAFQIIEKQRGNVKNQHDIIKIYDKKYAERPNLNETFIFLALHMQPEMTTSPLAGQFVYQDLIIELLDYYLPENIKIYIKEHPAQTNVGRNVSFYDKFYNRSRIKFIKSNYNSRELADNSLAVVTCTGSIGWEALIRCKPVIMFGNYFYQNAPGCFTVKSKKDLQNALNIILNGYKVEINEIDSFFQKVYDYSYFGFIDKDVQSILQIDDEKNNSIILEIIKKKIYNTFC